MTTPDADDAWLDAQVPRLDAMDPLVRRTVAAARERAARRRAAPLWPLLGALTVGVAAVMLLTRPPLPLPDAPLVALVVQEEEAAPMLEEPVDDEEMDSPGMMDVELDELAEDEVAAISERLKDWPRS